MKRVWVVTLAAVCACGGDNRDVYGPYDDKNTTVVGTTSGDPVIEVTGPKGSGECVKVDGDVCVPVDDEGSWCDRSGGPVDVVVVDGVVVKTVCYPPSRDDKTTAITSTNPGDTNVLQTANGTAIVFDSSLDGQPITGNIDVDGNEVSIYGNGPDKTIIDGDVNIQGNNVRIRGVTITGNLTIGLNTAAVLLSRVYGDVTISKNNSVFVDNDVYGNVSVSANNTTLVGNHVQGTWQVNGASSICDGDIAFNDADSDHVVDDNETGAELTCP